MRKFYTVLLTLLIVSSGTIKAQQEDMFSQYMFSGLMVNPAYAGSHPYWNISAGYRLQWNNFDGAPSSQFISADGSLLNKRMGLGFLVYNDEIGVTKSTDLYGNYAYHLPVTKNEKLKLGFGIRAGFSIYRANLTKLDVRDPNDFIFMTDIDPQLVPRFGGGVMLHHPKFYLGVSVPNIASVELTEMPDFKTHMFITGAYAWEIKEDKLVLKPSFLLRYRHEVPLGYDFNLNALLFNRLWLGASYQSKQQIIGIIEILATRQLRVGYSYGYNGTSIGNYSNGTHEISIGYDFNQKLSIMTPRYF